MVKRFLSIILAMCIMVSVFHTFSPIAFAGTNINIGDFVQMGTYYGEPILWRCVDIDENGPLMLSDKIICLKPFDASGDNVTGSHGRGYDNGYYRKVYGSNYWVDSNIRCWLNSDAKAGNVQYACGNPPISENVDGGYNDYADEAGFLTYFSSAEKGYIKSVTLKQILDGYEYSTNNEIQSNHFIYNTNINEFMENYENAYSEESTDKIFLLDVSQVNNIYNNRDILGNDYYVGRLSDVAISNNEDPSVTLNANDAYSYRLRTPCADGNGTRKGAFSRAVSPAGIINQAGPNCASSGIRPAFYLLDNVSFSGDGSESNPYAISSQNDGFQVDIYRANHLTTSEVGNIMEDTYININKTPGKILYDAGQENGLDDAAAAWTAVMDTLNAVDNPSSIADYVFEEKDIYSAIIMNMFESSVDYEFMEYIDNEVTKQSKSLIGTVTSSMKNLYNFDVIDAEAVRNMTDKQKEDFEKELKEAYKEVHGTASTTSDITKIISNGIKYGKDVQKICETIEVYKNIRDLSDSMKFVMLKMYDKCPNSNMALKSALLECISVMDSGKAAFTAEMTIYSVGIIGKDVAQAGIDKLWGSVKTSFSVAHPAAFAFQTAYAVGKYVTQVCYNADGIVEKYYNLVAMVNLEQVMALVYDDIKNSFQSNPTQFNAAVYNNVVDVMFNMIDTDCDYVIAYAEAIDSSLASKLATAFGDNTVEELKQSVKSIQSSTSLFHVTVLTDWITQLYEDDIDKYYDYEYLIDKSYESYRKKYNINCPVDVYIYDLDGNIVGSVVDDVHFCVEDSDITILVSGNKKTIYMNNADEYNIVYEGNDNGTMDITITEYDEMKSTARSVNFNNIVLTDGLTYTSSENGATLSENAYVLMDETGECIEPDYDSLTAKETEKHIAEITRGYFTDTMDVSRQLNYGQNVEITAYIPEGYAFVSWTSDSSEEIFEDASSITTKMTMPDYDVNITANIVYNRVTVTIDGEDVETEDYVVLGRQTGYETYNLPEDVIGYYIDDMFVDAGKYEVAGGEVITTVNFNLAMVNGAQVRYGGGLDDNGKINSGNGLRFLATVDRSAFDGECYGMKITAEGSDEETIVEAANWQNDTMFSVAITNMPESNFIRKFTATPFVKVKYDDGTEKAIYGKESVTRSIYQVASGLLATGSVEDEEELIEVLNAYANQTGIRLVIKDDELKANTNYTTNGAYNLEEGELHFEVSCAEYDKASDTYSVILTPRGNAEILTHNNFWYDYIRINNNNSLVKDKVTIEPIADNEKGVKLTFKVDGLIKRPADDNADNTTPDPFDDEFDPETENFQ